MKNLKELALKEQITIHGGDSIDDFIGWIDAGIEGISHAVDKTKDEIYKALTDLL